MRYLKIYALCLGVFLLILASDNSDINAQEDLVKFQFDLNRPVVRHGGNNEWDARHTAPGAVVFHNGQFHMFRNGYRGWPQPSQVGYLTSEDGVRWTEVMEQPVFSHGSVPFNTARLALLTSAIVEDDGTWVFYFAPFNSQGNPTLGVLRATAATPTSPWVMDDHVLLEPGRDGEWDENFMAITNVIKNDEGYFLYYAAGNNAGDMAIGLATSDDGIQWSKNNNPSTSGTFSESDPVLRKTENWEVNIQDPRVVNTPDGWVMLYSSFDGNFRNQGYNIAISDDGIHWEKIQSTPVLARSDINRNPWYPELAYRNGIYYFYLEADTFDGGTDIFVSTFSGSFR